MRNSNLLKWAQSKQNDKGNRNWIHPPDTLQKGHIAYLVKFMGNTEVDQPKGIEVVKEGIRKLKFNQQLKKSEGTKIPKVELTISIDGVAIQEPKTNRIMHQYPLHRISYCADDKGEKKFFSFIAKEGPDSERHMCFVFVSDKLAEEITLTIGQAFDLAYKRFLETSGKELEAQRRVMLLQQRVNQLEAESTVLRQRLSDVLNGHASDLVGYMKKNKITNMLVVDEARSDSTNNNNNNNNNGLTMNGSLPPETNGGLLLNLNETPPASLVPPVPPRSFERNSFINDTPTVGTKLEGLLLDDLEDDFNPRAFENTPSPPTTLQQQQHIPAPFAPLPSTAPGLTLGQTLFGGVGNNGVTNGSTTAPSQPAPLLAPPPRQSVGTGGMGTGRGLGAGSGVGFSNKTSLSTNDPFGMDDFGSNNLESAIGLLDKRILEMKDGFSRGLTFGNEDFSIESLDPLRK